MTDYRCFTHGTEHVVPGRSYQGHDMYRCAVDTGGGTKCGKIALPAPPRVPRHRRIMLLSRAAVELTMCTLIIGFWISAAVWVRFIL